MPQTQEITVGLRFTANTEAARTQLNSLKNDLNNLSTLKNINIGEGLSDQLLNASNAAAQLKIQLQEATNVKTGNLDLTKFAYSLKQSGMSLEKYRQQLLTLGPDGQKAFFQLTSSIQSAEIPLLRINNLFGNLWATLKRTASWQFSSTAIHAVLGAMHSAYSYAQDLNKSLNDIRIVTGQSVDQMDKFAIAANRAAKALSTTTNEYAKASLIYYQQGLSDAEVQARTDVTIKLANVSRQSAETVSDQMTAVWNNFAKGGEDLELFADKMVALGASTASSSEEIATGLEKFAAVADVVGLSFDYASAALATVTATTRQSADTVGTAFKTLFARLEGLKLGETLDDGTDLNKYSAALASVGVNIKDVNGELKDMDTILDETMAKWDSLSKDQQMALAQTVAGVRQYTQFIALMDNADFFRENLNTVVNSEGTLQEQADIYAESWEAASKRVKASAESIYSNLLDDKFFIKVTNGLAKILDGVNRFIEALGGLKGLLPGIAALILKISGDKIAANLDKVAFGFKNLIQNGAQGKALKEQASVLSITNLQDRGSETERAQGTYYNAMSQAQAELMKRAPKMSESELKLNEILLDRLKTLGEINIKKAEALELAEKETKENQLSVDVMTKRATSEDSKKQFQNTTGMTNEVASGKINEISGFLGNDFAATMDKNKTAVEQFQDIASTAFDQVEAKIKQETEDAVKYADQLGQLLYKEEALEQAQQNLDNVNQEGIDPEIIAEATAEVEKLTNEYNEFEKQVGTAVDLQSKMEDSAARAAKGYSILGQDAKKAENKILDLCIAQKNQKKASLESARAANKLDQGLKRYKKDLDSTKTSVSNFSKNIIKAAQTMSQVIMAVNSLSAAWQTAKDPDMSGWEKFKSIMTSVSFAIPGIIAGISGLGKILTHIKDIPVMIASGLNTFKTGLQSLNMIIASQNGILGNWVEQLTKTTLAKEQAAFVTRVNNSLLDEEKAKTLEAFIMKKLYNSSLTDEKGKITANTAAKLKDLGVTEGMTAKDAAAAVVKKLKAVATGADTVATEGNTVATIAGALANIFYESTMLPVLAVVLAVVAALAILTVTIMLVAKAMRAQEDSIKKVNESLENTTKNYEDAKKANEEFKESLKGYQDGVDKLKELVKGTEEYKNTLQETNDQARKLIATHKELQGKYRYNTETGLIEIDQDALDNLEYIQDQRLTSANELQILAQKKVDETNTYWNRRNAVTKDDTAINVGSGAAAYFSLLSPGLAPLLTRLTTVAQGFKELRNTAQQEALDKYAKAIEENGNLTLEEIKAQGLLTSTEVDFINALGLTNDELLDLGQEINANTNAQLMANKQIVSEAFSMDENFSNSRNKEALSTMLGKDYQKYYDQALKKVGKSDFKKYATQQGLSYKSVDGDVVTFLDSEGNERKLSKDSISAYFASESAKQKISGAIEGYNNTLNSLRTQHNATADALYAQLSTGNVQNIKVLSAEEKENLPTTAAEIQKALGLDDDAFKELYLNLGYNSAKDFAESFSDSLQNKLISVEDITNSLSSNLKDQLSNNPELLSAFENQVSQMSISAAQGYSSMLNDLVTRFEDDGVELGEAFINMTEETVENADLDSDQLETFYEEFGKISDLKNADALDDFYKSLKNGGVITKDNEAIFKQYIETSKKVGQAVKAIDYTELLEQLSSMAKIMDKATSGTKEYTEEEYKSLEESGVAMDNFVKTLDGYRYLGDAEDLAKSIKGTMQETSADVTNNLMRLADAADSASEASLEAAEAVGEKAAAEEVEVNGFQAIAYILKDIWEKVVLRLREVLDDIKSGLTKAWTWIKEKVLAIPDAIHNFIVDMVNGIIGFLNKAIDGINNLLPASFKISTIATIDGDDDWYSKAKKSAAQEKQSIEEHNAYMTEATNALNQIESSGQYDSENEILGRQTKFTAELNDLQAAISALEAKGEDNLSRVEKDELDRLKERLEATQDLIEANEKALALHKELSLEEDLEKLGVDTKEFSEYRDLLIEQNPALKDNLDLANKITVQNLKLNAGIKDLNENLAEYRKALNPKYIGTKDYSDALKAIKQDISDITGLELDNISDEFAASTTAADLLANAVDGDTTALVTLQEQALKTIAIDIEDTEAKNKINALIDDIALKLPDNIQIGTQLSEIAGYENWVNTLNSLLEAGLLTEEQMNEIFDGIRFDPQVDYEQVKISASDVSKVAVGNTIKTGDGRTVTVTQEMINRAQGDGYIAIPRINAQGTISTGRGSYQASAISPSSTDTGTDGSSKSNKNVRDEIDRYHEVNAELDDLSKKMDELSTIKDRAWGGKRIAAIRAEQQALKEYGEVLQRKLQEAEQYLQEDASYLNAYGAIYDEEGRLLNSNDIIAQAVANYNSGAIDDDEYNKIKTYISNYEDSLEKYKDTLYDIAENARNELDKQFEEVEVTVEVNIDIDDKKIEYLEWLVNHLQDEAFNEAETVATASLNFDNMVDKWNDYTKGIHDILSTAGASESMITDYINGNADAIAALENLTDEAKEKIGEYTDNLRDTYDSLIDLKNLIEEQLSAVWDDWNEKIEHQMDLMDHYDSIIDHYKNIIDIVGAKPLGMASENLIRLAKAQVEAGTKITEAIKSNLERQQNSLVAAQQELQRATTESDKKYWEERISDIESAIMDSENNLYSSIEDTLQRASDLFDTTLNQAIKDFEGSISSAFSTFEEAQELLKQQKTLADQYIPEYKKLYELSKLNRQIAQDLENASSVSTKQKLSSLQDEINEKLKDGVQLSEYDLEYLQKKYNLRLAEIALEEAQNAKNKVRLRRDSNGNYNYVYTADDDKIEDQIQNYEDKLYEIQDLTENYLNELSESYVQTMAEMTSALANIRREDYASEEEYMAKVDQVKTYYTTRLQYYTNEINKALDNNQQLYLEDKLFTDNIYSDKEARQRAFITDFHDTLVGGIMVGYDNIEDVTTTLEQHLGGPGQSGTLIGTMCDNWQNWHDTTDEILKQNGTSIDTFSKDLEEAIWGSGGIDNNVEGMKDGILERMEDTKDSIDDMAQNAQEDFADVARAIGDFQIETSSKLDQLKTDTEAYTTAHLNLLEALARPVPEVNITKTTTEITKKIVEDNTGGSGNNGGGGVPQTSLASSADASLYFGKTKFTGTGTGKTLDEAYLQASADADKKIKTMLKNYKVTEEQIKLFTQKYIGTKPTQDIYLYVMNDGSKGILSTSKLTDNWATSTMKLVKQFATGGYTGDWGSEGRLAMLHEKELVLNKQDTSNMLQTVNIVRDIAKKIDLNVQTGGKISLDKIGSFSSTSKQNNNLENNQNITIYADFPSVTVDTEIQKAFDNMAMQAFQYAYIDN